MKDYIAYSVEDFVSDESYLRYYYQENEKDIRFWSAWIRCHPENLDVIISANNYLEAFSIRLSDTEFQQEQQRFAKTLKNLSENPGLIELAGDEYDPAYFEESELLSVKPVSRIARKAIAISLVIVLLASVYYSFFRPHKVSSLTPAAQHTKVIK